MVPSLLLSLLLPALVSAHGYVNKISIDGTVYQGNSVGTTATIQSVIRQVNTNSPVQDATNPNLNCGQGAQLAANVANANPGSTVEVYWVGGVSGDTTNVGSLSFINRRMLTPVQWPHNTGPIMHYMTLCDGSCASYNSTSAEWFKISELGLKPGNTTWYQADIRKALATFPKPILTHVPESGSPVALLQAITCFALSS